MKFLAPLLIVILLAGCGRKPQTLWVPDEGLADAYPQIYPKPLPSEVAVQEPQSDDSRKYNARPVQGLQ